MLVWIVFAGLTALALAAVLWPLTRAHADADAVRDDAIYRDQLKEIERDLERGLIDPSEADSARTEIARRLLAADEARRTRAPVPVNARRSATAAFACALVCVPGLSLSLYLLYGSPGVPDQPLSARLEAPAQGQPIESLIARVEARLREHPQDGAGWDAIAPVYLRLGRFDDAADAYARALRLQGETPARLSGYGEALVNANNGIVTEAALNAFEKAHAKDPTLLRPRFWTAMAREQDGDHAGAAAIYRAMLGEADAGAPWRPMVEERLRTVGGDPAAIVAKAPPQEAAGEQRGPTAEDVAAAREMSEEARAAMIEQMVQGLADRLAQDANDLEGWLRLVRAYNVLGRRDDATEALGRARHAFHGDAKAAAALDELAATLGL